jgi:hypothetical protein
VIGKSGRAVAGVLVALALGLGGCAQSSAPAAGGDNAQAAQTALPSVLPPPSAPPTAKQRSEPGAVAFVRYWFQTLDYATQTGDIGPLTKASDPDCQACEAALTIVRQSYSDGGYLQGGTYTVRSITNENFAMDDRPLLSVSFDRSSRSGFGPDGQVRNSLPAAAFVTCQLTLAWDEDTWKVASVIGDPLPT